MFQTRYITTAATIDPLSRIGPASILAIARARALIRRGKGVRTTVTQTGFIGLNLAEQKVSVEGQFVDLSRIELRILEYLIYHPRTMISKLELLEHLYDCTWEHHSNVIEAHVSNLRRKLRNANDSTVLETLRGRGYRLRVPERRSGMKSNSLIRRSISAVLLIEMLCALAFVLTALRHERRTRFRALDVAL